MDCLPNVFFQWLPIIGSSFVALTSIILHFINRRPKPQNETTQTNDEIENQTSIESNLSEQEQQTEQEETILEFQETTKPSGRRYSITIEDILKG